MGSRTSGASSHERHALPILILHLYFGPSRSLLSSSALLIISFGCAASSYAQPTMCSMRCPNGSMSEPVPCDGSVLPACQRPTASSTSSAPAGAPAINPALTNAAQTIGTALGQRLAKALLGGPDTTSPVDHAIDAAQQQTALAAHQLNESGIYLLKQRNYSGAINEFQKALALEPGDAIIGSNLEFAKQAQKNAIVAGQTSNALGQLLGADPAGMGSSSDALNLVNLGPGATPVDLRNATSTIIDPATLKGQLDSIFSDGAPISAPADAQELDKLFQPSQPAPSSPMQGKIDRLNAQCAAVVPGSAADESCKQQRTELEHADQQQLDEIFSGPAAPGQNQAAPPPHP